MRISQFNSTKLLIAVIGLLIGAFVMLSMSLPDEQVGEGRSNHSGPRRSHWKTTGMCGDSYSNKEDYGQIVVIAEKGDNGEPLGKISVSADHSKSEPKNNNNVEQTTITWNCGLNSSSQESDFNLAAAHRNTVTIDVTPSEGYHFSQWRSRTNKEKVVTHEASGTRIIYTSIIGNGQLDRYSDSQNKDSWEDKNNPWVDTIWICFAKQNVEFDVTFNPAEQPDCSYTVDGEPVLSSSPLVKNSGTSSTYEATLSATAGADWKFAGWFVVNDDATLTFKDNNNPAIFVFNEPTTITAKFVRSDAAPFKVDGKEYLDLNTANTVALTSTSKTIILAGNGILYDGDYTISSGVTLLIPDDREVVEREEPTPMDAAAASNLKPFRTLTMDAGAKIYVGGAISVASKLFATAGGRAATQSGVKTWYGYIFMESGSEIVLNDGGVLYAWGYISGDGEVTAKNGSKVYEMFQFTDFRGGSAILAMGNKVFPFSQYYVQNIEVKLNVEFGATEYVRTDVYASSAHHLSTIKFIGTDDAFFAMLDGTISKQYIPLKDRMHYIIGGNLRLNSITLTVSSLSLSSKKYVFPITNNLTIDMKAGSSFELSQDMSFLPGVELNIEKGAKFTIPSETNLYIYDLNEWQNKGFVMGNVDFQKLDYVARNGSGKAGSPTSRTLSDARIRVDGELEVTGGLYTTTSGADIYSIGGGKINYLADAVTDSKTYQYTQSGSTVKKVDIPITSSYLHNALTGDVEYTLTTAVTANTTINYRNGHWGWLTKWIDYDGTSVLHQAVGIGRKVAGDYDYAGDIPPGMVWDYWKTIADEENQEVTYIAQLKEDPTSAVGDVIDIVDWTANTVTLNLNGIPATGWPYIINGKEYTKDKRAADRTLTIPYDGSANDGLVITLTKNGGEVYSRHTYTIPHIITTSADLTGVQATSVVFAKDDAKLSVTENVSVSKIVIAPGAELSVNSGVTLTVGDLLLRTTAWQAAILDNQGTINATHTYYTRIVASNSQYYQFALPLASDVKNVTLSSKSKCTYGTSWLLKSYDEASRAKNGEANTEALSNWKPLEADASGSATIAASVGYEMFSNTPYYREFYFPVVLPASKTTEVPVSHTDGAAGAAHAGWNALCSPLTGKFTQTFSTPSEGIKVSELTEDGNYLQCMPTVIYPAVPFYYQAPKSGTLDFSDSELIQKAPQRAWNTSASEQWLRLMLNDATGRMLDETNIFTHPENFSVDYESGYDVIKQSTTGGKALLYSELVCGALAFAALPDSAAESRILLTVYAAEAKPYTFHLEDNAYLNRLNNVYLHDTETGAVIDLLTSDYEASLREGTTRGRFYITCVFKAPNITTDVETTIQDKQIAPIQKVFYNGKVYILRNGIVYDLTGRQCEMK